MLPNFLIIGAARCATTTLYAHLQGHPDVYLPLRKRPEPHFFLKEAELAKGLIYYEKRYFADWRGEHAVGEASTSYLFGPEVPQRIAAMLPEVKLLCLLRHPVDRAFSGYWHTVAAGLEPLSFEEAIAAEPARKAELAGTPLGEIAPFAYLERGFYYEQLTRWLARFNPSQLKVLIFEEFLAQPQRTLAEVADFLGIDSSAFPARPLAKENTSVGDGVQMPATLYRSLTARFADDVSALEVLVGRDLSHWKIGSNSHVAAW